MIIVLTTGTFDILHYGHINLLKRARELGDYLVVGLNVKKNGKDTFYSYEERKKMLESIKYVNAVVPIYEQKDKYKYIEQFEVNLFAIGSDYIGYSDIDNIKRYCEVVFIERTTNISTTKVKEYIKPLPSDKTVYNRIVVDIDDTICTTIDRDFENSIPNIPVINKINELYDKGMEIILYTARGGKSCQTLEEKIVKYGTLTTEWLKKNGVKYNQLLFGKLNADYYVDDKNLSIDEFLKL
jgi:glycerol-3-phosphate cytidylyltransferase